ncbi:MAG: GC-type dockerin domain-anchored protein [Planctomycetota bacterium]
MNYCKNITVKGVTLDASGPDRLRHHHGFGMANSADCLVEDFEIKSRPLHGIYFGNFCVNNVYSRGVMHHGTFDYHKRMPYANVHTEISIFNDGDAGGAAASGPIMGARHTHWNINLNRTSSSLTAQPDIMPKGALVGIQCATPAEPISQENGDPEILLDAAGPYVSPPSPPNLYEAQLALRLGQPIPVNAAAPACADCEDDAVYDFAFGGAVDTSIIGQDNWTFSRDFSGIDGDNARLQTAATHPDGPLSIIEGRNGRDSVLIRQNDLSYAFTPHRYIAEGATFRFDARAGEPGGSAGNVSFIINNSDTRSEGIQFGMTQSTFEIRGGIFSNVLRETVSVPSGWYTRGEWARLELRVDFTAGATGEASLFFMNLSDGDTEFRAVPGLQNISLEGEVRYPETWDRLGFRLRNAAAATNLVANAGAVLDACCEADWDGDNVLTAEADLVGFVASLEAGDRAADLDMNGTEDAFDLLAYLELYSAGCP